MFVELKYFFNLAKAKQNKHYLNYFIMTTKTLEILAKKRVEFDKMCGIETTLEEAIAFETKKINKLRSNLDWTARK